MAVAGKGWWWPLLVAGGCGRGQVVVAGMEGHFTHPMRLLVRRLDEDTTTAEVSATSGLCASGSSAHPAGSHPRDSGGGQVKGLAFEAGGAGRLHASGVRIRRSRRLHGCAGSIRGGLGIKGPATNIFAVYRRVWGFQLTVEGSGPPLLIHCKNQVWTDMLLFPLQKKLCPSFPRGDSAASVRPQFYVSLLLWSQVEM